MIEDVDRGCELRRLGRAAGCCFCLWKDRTWHRKGVALFERSQRRERKRGMSGLTSGTVIISMVLPPTVSPVRSFGTLSNAAQPRHATLAVEQPRVPTSSHHAGLANKQTRTHPDRWLPPGEGDGRRDGRRSWMVHGDVIGRVAGECRTRVGRRSVVYLMVGGQTRLVRVG